MLRATLFISSTLVAGHAVAQAEPIPIASDPVQAQSNERSDVRFATGRSRLTGPVSEAWSSNLPRIRKAYLEGTWSELVRLVLTSNANLDLAYFYLGRGAEGLGYTAAARTYYIRARSAPHCVGEFEVCHGYSPVSDLEPRLSIITSAEAAAGPTSLQPFAAFPAGLWNALSEEQRNVLDERYVVEVIAEKNYGVIIDAQTVNESTPGSTAGSQLGAAYGSAAYLDRAFKGAPQNWNYSATGQLTSSIAGALVGSLLDKNAQSRFHTRYTIRSNSGDVGFVDSYSGDQFTHPAGLCVQINPFRPLPSDLCQLTLEKLLSHHFGISVPAVAAKIDAGEPRSVEARLRELKSIYDKGMITKDIFERKREDILKSL
jgi:hypothetical protein